MIARRRRTHQAWALVLAALIAVGAGGFPGGTARAQEESPLETRVKAAFLYKFIGYVDWPAAAFPRADTPVVIAVVGAAALAAELGRAVAGRTVNDRPLVARRLLPGEPLDGVHVLFVGKTESARLPQLVSSAQARSILTVTESEGALAQGSIINFVMAERRVRFEIALDSAEKSRLKLSSRLLAVARQVRMETP